MKTSFFYKWTISVIFSIIAASCAPSTPTTSTTTASTSAVTTKPSASASPSSSATPSTKPSPSAKPSESPITTTPKPDQTSDTVRVAVINNSGKVLKAIYMSAPKKEDWGENELDAPIPDREKADFVWKRSDYKGDDAGCVFDIVAEYADGKSAELDPIDVCKTPAINLN